MSSRALRRALKETEEHEDAETGEGELDNFEPLSRRGNMFDAFALDTCVDAGSDTDNEAQTEETGTMTVNATVLPKKATKPVKPQRQSFSEENFDKLFNDGCTETLAENALGTLKTPNPLALDLAWLDPNVELKRKFGGSVGTMGNVMTQVVNANRRGLGFDPRTGRKVALTKPYKRRDGFISPRLGWPAFAPSETNLRIVADGDRHENVKAYRIEQLNTYGEDYDEFALLVEMADLDGLMMFVREHPLFIDSLLVLSDALRMQSTGDAGEMTEMALYILERIIPGEVKLTTGNVRFLYAHQPNRKLHLALFRLIQFTMKKSCWRVALQQSKALLSLDPAHDPLAAHLFVDFLCIQAEAFEELEALDSLLKVKFPGWKFNMALKKYLKDRVSPEILVELILAHPFTANLLAESLKVRIPSSWTSAYSAVRERCDQDTVCVSASKLFVARSLPIWKRPDVESWFLGGLALITAMDPSGVADLSQAIPQHEHLSIYRHSVLSDLTGVNIAIPPAVIKACGGIHSHDPLCPEIFEDSQNGIIQRLQNLWTSINHR